MLCLHYVGWRLDSPWACLRRCVSTQVLNDSVVSKRVAGDLLGVHSALITLSVLQVHSAFITLSVLGYTVPSLHYQF